MITFGLIYAACGLATLVAALAVGNGAHVWPVLNAGGRVLFVLGVCVTWPLHLLVWLLPRRAS